MSKNKICLGGFFVFHLKIPFLQLLKIAVYRIGRGILMIKMCASVIPVILKCEKSTSVSNTLFVLINIHSDSSLFPVSLVFSSF